MTVVSDSHFSPKAFQIKTKTPQKVFVVGLVIELVPFAANKEISKYNLGSHLLKEGTNIIPCSILECFRQYSMMIFVMNPVSVDHIAIYSRNRKESKGQE